MGVFGALNAAVSGLTAQAYALENISGNIANASTTGYKRLDTSFSDLVGGGSGAQTGQIAGTVSASSRATNSLQGDLQQVDVNTYMAIQGSGYFVVQGRAGARLTVVPSLPETISTPAVATSRSTRKVAWSTRPATT